MTPEEALGELVIRHADKQRAIARHRLALRALGSHLQAIGEALQADEEIVLHDAGMTAQHHDRAIVRDVVQADGLSLRGALDDLSEMRAEVDLMRAQLDEAGWRSES